MSIPLRRSRIDTADTSIEDLPCHGIMFIQRFIPALFVWLYALSMQGQCAVPTSASLFNRSNSHIKISFSSSATYHQVSYGTLSFNLSNGNPSAWFTGLSFQANGLEASTGYDFYVRDSCSNGSVSAWSPYYANSTLCGVAVMPWFESFDQDAFTQQTSWNTTGNMPNCWPRNPTTGYLWDIAPAQFSSNWTGPSSDHTGRSKYASMDVVGFAGNNLNATLRTPQISLDTFSTPELSFWYHMFGNGVDKLTIQAKDKNGAAGWTTLGTLNGQQQTSASSAWKEETLPLTAFAGDTIFLRFVAYRNSTFTQLAEISIDDILVRQGSGCAKPTNLQVSNVTSNAASLSWLVGNGTLERVSYGSPGTSAAAGTQVNASGGGHVLTGLTPNTNYIAYVKDSCTAGSSSWVGPVAFRTSCLPVSAPFSENFDGSSWTVGSWGQLGSIDNCWQRPDTLNYFWTPGPPTFPAFNTGPTQDHSVGSGGKYLMGLSVGFAINTPAHVLSPLIDLSPLDTPTVTFWYHMYGVQIDSMVLDINNGSGWSQIWQQSGQQQTSKTAAWKEAIIDVSAYADDSIRLRWRAVKTVSWGNQSQMAIDDVSVHEKAACSKPTNLSINATTTTSVTLDWSGGSNPWQVAFGLPGFTPNSINTMNANSKPFTVTGLTPGTTYAFYVRDSCGLSGVSTWLGPIQATTLCASVTAPWSENFNGSDWVPASWWPVVNAQIANCWNRSDTTGYFWAPQSGASPWANTGPSGDVQGTGKYVMTNVAGFTSQLSTMITTPWIDVTPLDTPQVHFWSHLYGSNVTSLQVEINDGSGWSAIGTVTTGNQSAKTDPWTETIIDLYAYRDDTLRFRFTGNRTNGWMSLMGLDDISVVEAPKPVCGPPTSLAITNISPTSGDLGFNSSGQSQVAWGASGFTPSASMASTSSGSYSLTGLSSNTSYDVYVRDSCGPTFYSAWVGPITFSTLPCPNVSAAFSDSGTLLNRTFSASNPNSGNNYVWDFGDGNQGVGHPVNHSYATAGNYPVTLIQSNSCGGSDSVTQSTQVCGQLLAGFTASISGTSALFTSTSTGASSLLWDFGDGNSAATNPANHTYANNGIYTVVLTVYNPCGLSAVSSQSVAICEAPTPAFTTFILSSGSSGMWVKSDASLSVGVNNYTWSWGDGTTSSGGPIKQHHYAVPSLSYVVTLTIDNVCGGSASLSKQLGEMIGLDDISTRENTLYPNPTFAGSVVHWTGLPPNHGPIQLSNFSGKILHDLQGQWANEILTITLPNDLPAGMVVLTCGDQRVQLAIVSH